jgi:hypothetical protein
MRSLEPESSFAGFPAKTSVCSTTSTQLVRRAIVHTQKVDW